MKKLLSFLLVVCMLLTSCIAFSSCSKVSEKEVEKDPQAVLNEALENTGSEFFTTDFDMSEIVEKALASGSIAISVEAGMLKSQIGLGKITETLYMDSEQGRVVSDTVVNYNNEDLSARIFMDKNGMMLNSEAILGSNNTYLLNPITFAEKFSTSAIAQMFGLTADTMPAEVQTALDSMKASWASVFENTSAEQAEEAAANANALLAVLNQVVSTEKVANAEGKEVKCVVITYTINNDTLKAFLEKALEIAKVDNADVKTMLDEAMADMKASEPFEATLKVCINKKTNQIEKVILAGEVKNPEDQSILYHFNASVSFSANEIALNAKLLEGAESTECNVKLTKEQTADAIAYKLAASTTAEGVTADIANATFTLMNTGDFTLDVAAGVDEDKLEATITGKLTVNEKDASIAITSAKAGDFTVEFNATITFNAEAEIPAAPTDAKDVMDLTEEDIEGIMADFQNSKLGKLIFGAAQ